VRTLAVNERSSTLRVNGIRNVLSRRRLDIGLLAFAMVAGFGSLGISGVVGELFNRGTTRTIVSFGILLGGTLATGCLADLVLRVEGLLRRGIRAERSSSS
jgi:hypothetical protein